MWGLQWHGRLFRKEDMPEPRRMRSRLGVRRRQRDLLRVDLLAGQHDVPDGNAVCNRQEGLLQRARA